MRTYKVLVAVAAVAATAAAVAVVPAMADPKGEAAPSNAIVGVGSNTIQDVMNQFSVNYNAEKKATARPLYSWDAVGPTPSKLPAKDAGDIVSKGPVSTKSPCLGPRPNGSGAGISAAPPLALTANTKYTAKGSTGFCTDFARSSSGPASPALPGIVFLPFAKDNVTYATNAKTNAPNNLSAKQLLEIYTCTVPARGGHPANNWADLGGKKGKIDAQLPQVSSGTRKFFLTAINGGTVPATPGTCVNSSKGESATVPPPNGNYPEENEGYDPFLQGPNVIYPYSAGAYIEQGNSAPCAKKGCPINPKTGVPNCKTPKGKQLQFGCDFHGNMVLRDVNGTAPTETRKGKLVPNPKFTPLFVRSLYIVVRQGTSGPTSVPGYLKPLFGPTGWLFTNKTAAQDICNYGFATLPPTRKGGCA
jgi:ABC-type phosphate transport system substrate-binding protein